MEQCQPGELKENQNIDNGCMSQIFVTEITMEMFPKALIELLVKLYIY